MKNFLFLKTVSLPNGMQAPPLLRPDVFNYFKLFTAAPPVFLALLRDTTVEAGKPLELTAAINAAAEPVEAVWQKDKKPVDTKSKGLTASCQNRQCTMKIDSCTLADSGEYSVIVKNPSGSVTCYSKITIKGLFNYSKLIYYSTALLASSFS